MNGIPGATRRTILRRGLVMLAGVIGLGAASSQANATVAPPTVRNGALTLHGRYWHQNTHDHNLGEPPKQGDRLIRYGELLDAPDGNKVGEFYSACFCMDAPFGPSAVAAANLELHTLSLGDGTIVGTGLGRPGPAGESVYAIVGGTGRYAGATGTYVARQRPHELGGDGTAEFTVTLTA